MMFSRRELFSLLALAAPPKACAVLLNVKDGRVLRCDDRSRAEALWVAPGSTIKALTWTALPKHRSAPCRRRLEIGTHRVDCTHAPLTGFINGETALAASCNSWFAEMARDLDPTRFHHILLQSGARAKLAQNVEQLQLQALGLEGVQFSPMTLAQAYRKIALSDDPVLRRGLERAVLEGTAQWAAPQGLRVAGKTGTTNEGAWFAGYAPVHEPRVVVTVFVEQGRGGGDAAPVAREILEWWRKSEFSR